MDESINQFPEHAARDNIDKQLRAAGWAVQDREKIDWNESIGIAIRGYQTDTYKTEEDPKSVLTRFRNAYNPRIAVTVAMISVGIDVKPLECLLFMRDVKSKGYFEQMKGRGTRTFGYEDLKKVTPSALSAKTHFVVVDAVGVTKSLKTDSL